MAAITPTETVIWTALPTGLFDNGDLALSVFVSPRLGTSNNSTQALSFFADFVDWPQTMADVTFAVEWTGVDPIGANNVTSEALDSVGWKAVFGANTTSVVPWDFIDYSGTGMTSYDLAGDHALISNLYGEIGAGSPTSPIEIVKQRMRTNGDQLTWGTADSGLADIFSTLLSIGGIGIPGANSIPGPLSDVLDYYNRPPSRATAAAYTPTVDFHQGLGALGSFPVLLRRFGLVFDLRVPLRAPLSPRTTLVTVIPSWTSHIGPNAGPGSLTNVSPQTSANVTSTTFLPTPLGTKDYLNGMLDVADTNRFSVTGADVDLASIRLDGLKKTLDTIIGFDPDSDPTEGSTAAVTVPALRSSGPTLVWTGLATQLNALATDQAGLQTALESFVTNGGSPPTFFAEHVIRGHRIDVLTTAPDAAPAWRSLMGRFGTYALGTAETVTAVDEGVVVPAGATTGTDDPQVSDLLYISERLARWNGWGLAAQFTGNVLDNDSNNEPDPIDNPENPTVAGLPQLSAYFQAPNLGGQANPFPFPKLRFGNSYRFRARSVDLAGNSVDVSSTDASTATDLFTHVRFEPVRPPALAHTAPLTTGESTLFLVLLDDQVNAPQPNGRWLFPPKTAPIMAEQHGMFDDPNLGTLLTSAYSTITPRDAAIITDATGVAFDTTNGDVNPTPYFPGQLTSTPWLPDPLSTGAALLGVPGATAGDPVVVPWPSTSWPDTDPVLLLLMDGASRSFSSVPGVGGTSSPVLQVMLPPAESATVRISSALTADELDLLGVWDWISSQVNASVRATLSALAVQGQLWLLTPYLTLRMVHAVRIPLLGPRLQKPTTSRQAGVTSVDISDDDFSVDENSTSVVDFEASWTDPYDDPTDPESDPGDPAKATKSFTGPAFRLQVPDPNPIGPDALPLTVSPPVQVFAFGPESQNDGTAGSTHHIGDTKHHTIYYTATGSSRFAELFQTSAEQTFSGMSPLQISTPALGINPKSVVITPVGGGTALVLDDDFTVDVAAGTISLTNGSGSQSYDVTYQPTITRSGPAVPVEVLSSTRPSAPHIARIRPAWEITHSDHAVVKAGRADVVRTGGYLRVFLERPWFTSGAHEMVGVVTQTVAPTTPTPVSQLPLTTTMGLDPITYSDAKHRPWPLIPTLFDRLGDVPVVAGRALYSDPPRLNLSEDDFNLYKIWPYPVHYDEVSQQWFADIHIDPGVTAGGTYPPPPGYFVRLALVRFQPYSIDGVELSPLTLATIAQPVPNRYVTVIADHKDKSHKSVLVTVIGPGYHGWRPPLSTAATQSDAHNPYAPQIYSTGTTGRRHSSTMAVDVQMHDTSKGLEGELAWRSVTDPVRLPVTFSDETAVEWGGEPRLGRVELPLPITSSKKMRLRISELDFYPDGRLPAQITNVQRRPFVTFIPVN